MLTILYTVGLVGALLQAVVASDPSYSSDCNKNEVSMLYNNVCLSDAKMQTQFQTFYIINIPSKALRKLSVLKSRQQAYAGAILLIVLQVSSRIVQSVLFQFEIIRYAGLNCSGSTFYAKKSKQPKWCKFICY